MTYSVTLEKQISPADTSTYTYLESPVRLKVTATVVVGFADLGIFTFMISQVTGVPIYNHVATTSDISDYTYQLPGGQDFVRNSEIDLFFDSAALAEEALDSIEDRIQLLCTDMEALQTFGTITYTTISS